jgi:hypothetical protein
LTTTGGNQYIIAGNGIFVLAKEIGIVATLIIIGSDDKWA